MKNLRNKTLVAISGLALLFTGCSEKIAQNIRNIDGNEQLTVVELDEVIITAQRFAPGEVPRYEDEYFQERIEQFREKSQLSMTYNGTVKYYINDYTVIGRKGTKSLILRSQKYFPVIEEVFAQHGVPQELKYLAAVESAFKLDARSHVGAVGLWQFMRPTAKDMGLKVTRSVDERKDAYKSTVAAAKYLKRLHNRFGDWWLVLAAYNYGQGNVAKAIRKAGGSKDYWVIQKYLPKETRHYVPKFIATAYVMENYQAHNIQVEEPVLLASTE